MVWKAWLVIIQNYVQNKISKGNECILCPVTIQLFRSQCDRQASYVIKFPHQVSIHVHVIERIMHQTEDHTRSYETVHTTGSSGILH